MSVYNLGNIPVITDAHGSVLAITIANPSALPSDGFTFDISSIQAPGRLPAFAAIKGVTIDASACNSGQAVLQITFPELGITRYINTGSVSVIKVPGTAKRCVLTNPQTGWTSGSLNVTLWSTPPTNEVSNPIAVTATGSVSITGTPTVQFAAGQVVSISGTPTVNVGNTPSVLISGTPTVQFAAGQVVSISGTPTVQFAAGQVVSISGTPTVNVGNTPSVSISGTPTVNIGANQNINIQNAFISVQPTAFQQVSRANVPLNTTGNTVVAGATTGNHQWIVAALAISIYGYASSTANDQSCLLQIFDGTGANVVYEDVVFIKQNSPLDKAMYVMANLTDLAIVLPANQSILASVTNTTIITGSANVVLYLRQL